MRSIVGKGPINSGPSYMNYKQISSVALPACGDTDGLFTLISMGGLRRNCGRHRRDEFPISSITSEKEKPNFLFCFVTNEAFLLTRYIMQPFTKRAWNVHYLCYPNLM
jgi:hypothetical protein